MGCLPEIEGNCCNFDCLKCDECIFNSCKCELCNS